MSISDYLPPGYKFTIGSFNLRSHDLDNPKKYQSRWRWSLLDSSDKVIMATSSRGFATFEEAMLNLEEQLKGLNRSYPQSAEYPFNPQNCLEAVDGDLLSLEHAFDWKKTPQGEAYWVDRCYYGVAISGEDKIAILRWVANYYMAQEK